MHRIIRATALVAISVAGCAPVDVHSEADRPPGEAYASVGDIALRVEKTDDLPNVFGRADVFGRKRNRGFSDLSVRPRSFTSFA